MHREPITRNREEQGGRSSAWRWLNIGLRTGHLGTAGVLFGGLILAVPFTRLGVWHWLTIGSGSGLLLAEWLADRNWPHRGKGMVALLHTTLAALIHFLPELTVPLLWMILVSGSIGSHMPRRFRHWSLLYGPERRNDESAR